MTTYEIYSFKVKSSPVFKSGYIVGYDNIEHHTIIVEDYEEAQHLLDNETCYDLRHIGNITGRELQESANRILKSTEGTELK